MSHQSPEKRDSLQLNDLLSLSRSKPRLPPSYLTDNFYSPHQSASLPQNQYDDYQPISETPQQISRLTQKITSPPLSSVPTYISPERDKYNTSALNNGYSVDILRHKNHQSDISSKPSGLLEKLMADQYSNSQHRAREFQLRDELSNQQKTYENSIHETNEAITRALNESNKKWEEIIIQKDSTILAIKQSHADEIESLKKAQKSREQEIEDKWRVKVSELELQIKAERETHVASLRIEREAHEFEIANRAQAKEEVIREAYEKKLKKYEKQLIEAEQAYRSKILEFETLVARNKTELQASKSAVISKEDSLKDEISLKEMQIESLQRRLESIEDSSRACSEWKTIATELAALVIRICSKATELPNMSAEVVMPGYKSFGKRALRTKGGWAIELGVGPEAELNEEVLLEYSILKRRALTLDRKALIRLLKHSKKVVEISESAQVYPSLAGSLHSPYIGDVK